ncbi:GNAT family N-acetyltransferase [Paenibacillus sp. GP183]|jgi:ribosomal protein S18 acetylase RimI-like enzyme|uniref:GNAT family N-acetyltransferase n=1 Tax=Paenibacillus sp. GP183 TaxID=1882751 RepID=UPI00089D9BCB|nr:GNAT family N-acetyltransferase [Paenibacillus sp. GP183]SEC11690.1 Acetyltransferase (GNAT) family protein [Paenibacillus sp. GP183]
MNIATWGNQYVNQVIALWNEEAVKESYKELSAQSFEAIFLSNPYFDKENTFVLLERDQVIGFACGCTGDDLPLGDLAGYITCIVLSSDWRTDENYRMLLDVLEHRFQQKGKKQADILFFNPIKLPWYIPDTPNHEHNNAPGLPVDSPVYAFLLSQGYKERVQESGMYLNLAGFAIPDDNRAKEEKAVADGYKVELFDPGKHYGVDDMLSGLNNLLWQKEIAECTADGVPVVIAAHQGKAVGFAGPVIRQENGRGYFTGIGVHPDHEGHGLGSILFFKLCEAFEAIGTEYMSLYTGVSNPAIRIYEKAGFKTIKYFSVMRREFSS